MATVQCPQCKGTGEQQVIYTQDGKPAVQPVQCGLCGGKGELPLMPRQAPPAPPPAAPPPPPTPTELWPIAVPLGLFLLFFLFLWL
jgi:hypothetical protein